MEAEPGPDRIKKQHKEPLVLLLNPPLSPDRLLSHHTLIMIIIIIITDVLFAVVDY